MVDSVVQIVKCLLNWCWPKEIPQSAKPFKMISATTLKGKMKKKIQGYSVSDDKVKKMIAATLKGKTGNTIQGSSEKIVSEDKDREVLTAINKVLKNPNIIHLGKNSGKL